MKPKTKKCQNCKKDFILESDDFTFYEKMKVPTPKICPTCRFKWRAMFRNETTLYSGRKCDLCDKDLITMYNPKSPYKVYCLDCYFSDKWDPKDYTMDYDSARPFFEQLYELTQKVPKMAVFRTNGTGQNINSEYVNMAGGLKNCYLVFNSGPDEECMYARGLRNCSEVVDGYFGTDSSQAYEIINVQKSNKIIYGKNIIGSADCYFSTNLSGCLNCFGCINLRNKSNHFLNQPIDPKKYKEKVKEILGSYEKIEKFKKEFEIFSLKFPRQANNNLKTVDSTGDYLYETKNVHNSFEVARSEDCRHLFSTKEIKDSIGAIGYGSSSELLCEVVAVGYTSRAIGACYVDQSQNIEYSFFCNRNNHDLFGCDALNNSKYCILNKQYSQEEYEEIKAQIIKELTGKDLYGLIMPPEFAPFAYNETIAQDNMPLTKEEAIKQGFRWEDDLQKTEGKETLKSGEIPDHIKDVPDSITKEILSCIDCQRNYKITKQELQFYRKMNLPVPRKCFFCRHKDRIARRGVYKFWDRNCAKCKTKINTNYAPDRPEIVYCKRCYQQEVI